MSLRFSFRVATCNLLAREDISCLAVRPVFSSASRSAFICFFIVQVPYLLCVASWMLLLFQVSRPRRGMEVIYLIVFSPIQRITYNSYFTPLVVCSIGKRKERESLAAHPPPTPRINKKQRYAGLRFVPVQDSFSSSSSQSVSLRRICHSLYDTTFLVSLASLFSPCLAASTSSFPHAVMNSRPLFGTVSSHSLAFNAVAFPVLRDANART